MGVIMKKQNDKKRVDWKRRGIVAAGVVICVLCGAFIFGFSRLHEGVGLSAGASADSYVMESAASVAPMMNEMAPVSVNLGMKKSAALDTGSNSAASFDVAEAAASDTADFGSSDHGDIGETEIYRETTAADLSDGVDESLSSEVDTQDTAADKKLIRTVNLSVETSDFASFTSNLEKQVQALGGYIENSNISGSGDPDSTRYADYTFRIPKPQVDAFLTFTEGEGNVTSKNESMQDITLQYHDTEARKKALQEEYDRLLELMAQAESVDAVISIEQRLSDLRYQLDSFSSDLRLYDNQVEYSTVYVSVYEKSVLSPTTDTSFWGRVTAGLENNVEALLKSLVNFAIWFISSLPMIILWVILCVAVVRITRLFVKRYDTKKAKVAYLEENESKKEHPDSSVENQTTNEIKSND